MNTSLPSPAPQEWHGERHDVAARNQPMSSRLGSAWACVHDAAATVLSASPSVSLAMSVGGQNLRFRTPYEFELDLDERTALPAHRVSDFEQLSSTRLSEMAQDIRRLEIDFSCALARADDFEISMRTLLAEFALNKFSKDHNWRSLFAALARREGQTHDGYRRVALVKYIQYLVNRRNSAQEIRFARQAQPLCGQPPSSDKRPTPVPATLPTAATASQANDDNAQYELTKLPAGTPVGVDLRQPGAVCMLLAGYPFRIDTGQTAADDGTFRLIDDSDGTAYELRNGTNSIGRAQDGDIVVNSAYRQVSRTHAVINIVDATILVVTDHSAHGTSLPGNRLLRSC